jgi:hypothetical protein
MQSLKRRAKIVNSQLEFSKIARKDLLKKFKKAIGNSFDEGILRT